MSGGKVWLTRKADNLSAIYEPTVGSSVFHTPIGAPSLLQG
jgi:hypothetical protein